MASDEKEGNIHTTLTFNSFNDISRKHEATIQTLIATNRMQSTMIESLEDIVNKPKPKTRSQCVQTGPMVACAQTQTHGAIISASHHLEQVSMYEKGIMKLQEKNAVLEQQLKQKQKTIETMKKLTQQHDSKLQNVNNLLIERNANLRADFKRLHDELKRLKREIYSQEERETNVIHISDTSSTDDDDRTTPSVASK